MKRVPRIIIALDTRWGWGRAFLRGIAAFAERHAPWDCDYTAVGPLAREDLPRLNAADGIIAHINTSSNIAIVKCIRPPLISVELGAPPHLPNVHCDPQAIGKMAAAHLVESGFRRFAFCAFHGSPSTVARGNAFVEALRASGYSCSQLNVRYTTGEPSEHAQVLPWLRRLAKPVAIFCPGDNRARLIASLCRSANIPVPAEVGILGVDNDELLCRLCHPQLSSIDPGQQQVGFEAARLLHCALSGGAPPITPLAIPPIRVVVRESSDFFAVEDPEVAAAISYIRQHIASGVSVKQLACHVAVSRRKLEQAFRQHLGGTIHEEILLVRFRRAERLLLDGSAPLAQIARDCGMTHPSRLNQLVHRYAGMTPLQYRETHQRKRL